LSGWLEGEFDGLFGRDVGFVGIEVGWLDGSFDGRLLGDLNGCDEGFAIGLNNG